MTLATSNFTLRDDEPPVVIVDFVENPDYWMMKLSEDAINEKGWVHRFKVAAEQGNLVVWSGGAEYFKTDCIKHNIRYQIPSDGKPGAIFVHGKRVILTKDRVSFFNETHSLLNYVRYIFRKLKWIHVIKLCHEKEGIVDLELVKQQDRYVVIEECADAVYIIRSRTASIMVDPLDGDLKVMLFRSS